MARSLLCLDLGSMTGWALVTTSASGYAVVSGTWDFRPSRFDGAGIRYVRFRKQLTEMLSIEVDGVFFEEVRRHISNDSGRVYGALFGVVTSLCEELNLPYMGVPVGTIKKFWTGKGNANKQSMIDEAHRRGYKNVADDNEADAIALAHYAHELDVDPNEVRT